MNKNEFYIGVYSNKHIEKIKTNFVISFRQLRQRNFRIPKNAKWMLDSGAFQEIKLYGNYSFTINEYFNKCLRYKPTFFVNMDYMCEPIQLKKSGMSTKEHLELSTKNQVKLLELSNKYNIELMGTIQGWKLEDYLKHIDMLKQQGLLLNRMGIGSICRRNANNTIINIIETIYKNVPSWVKLHGFGVKTSVLRYKKIREMLYSCDSMAWSFSGRVLGHETVGIGGDLFGFKCLVSDIKCFRHTDDCANCEIYLQYWYNKIIKIIEQ